MPNSVPGAVAAVRRRSPSLAVVRCRKGMCLNQRGNRGVGFEFRGRRYIIGTDAPEALLAAMHTAGVPR